MNTKDAFDWNLFLRKLSQDFLERLEDSEFASLPSEIIDTKWLGYAGATDTEISAVEERLEITLPPSYRSFLAASNGWLNLDNLSGKLLSTQDINWLALRKQEVINDWIAGVEMGGGSTPVPDHEYVVYGDEQDVTSIRNEYLQTALEVGGDLNQGLLLLNPKIVFENGEWEAWFFAHWLPGANRYRSFQELMQERHKTLLAFPKFRSCS
jgi:SMI1 / KNR4 family (SUKH-1)